MRLPVIPTVLFATVASVASSTRAGAQRPGSNPRTDPTPPPKTTKVPAGTPATPPSTSTGASGGVAGPRAGVARGTTSSPPMTISARQTMLLQSYADGKARNPRVQPEDASGWQAIARMTQLDHDALVASYDAIYVADLAYKYLLHRHVQPTDSALAVALVQRMRNGESWQDAWRDVAQSPAVETLYGAWAPSRVATPQLAQSVFGLDFAPSAEQCFGALGDMCDGGVPTVYPSVQPHWSNFFTMPDGTQMGYVDVGVDVGSILFHNQCVGTPMAQGCSIFAPPPGTAATAVADTTTRPGIPRDLTQAGVLAKNIQDAPGTAANGGTGPLRAAAWNKAIWNVIDGRKWRATFGPYPTDFRERRQYWYDDIRRVPARDAWMAPVPKFGLATPAQTMQYTGTETRASQLLAAPGGTQLDGRDAAYCRSHVFGSTASPPLKAPLGVCR